MTISELIEMLEEQKDVHGDIDVRIAYQPSWPLSATVANVRCLDEEGDGEYNEDGDENPDFEPAFCWIATGSTPYHESGYAPSNAWEREW